MDTKLIEKFNTQLNQEFYSAYLYFAMATYFDEIAMIGFSKFMKHKASEKLNCAQKIYDYIILRDERLTFSRIEEPSIDWINVSDIFNTALSHEEYMQEKIKELYKIAKETEDFAALEFISQILNKQLKAVSMFKKLVFRIKNSDIISPNIEYLDNIIEEIKL